MSKKLHTFPTIRWESILLFFFILFTAPAFAQSGTIGDQVWSDFNGNGLQEAGEPGMAGVMVILYDGNNVSQTFTFTDQNGKYEIEAAPGWYRLKFANPGGVLPSPEQQGSNADDDSDQDFLGFTAFFTLADEEVITNLDAGFMPFPPPCTLSIDVLDVVCDDNGTDSDSSDDLFSFTLSITGGGPWGWSGGGQGGDYGVPTVFGPYSIAGGEVCLNFHDMDNPTCEGDVCVNPPNPCSPGPCDNVTNGGIIDGNETGCGPFNPSIITELSPPSGGSGDIEYMWLASKNGCPTDFNQRIFGANGPSYDPPAIFQTMYYVRWSRRVGCPDWINGWSNCVVKEVMTEECGSGICESRMAMNSTLCDTEIEYSLRAPGLILSVAGVSEFYRITEGQMTEFNDGTAKILARLKNLTHPDVIFEMEADLSGRTFHPQAGSPNDSECYNVYTSDWYYYENIAGTLTGYGAVAGGSIAFTRTGSAFQMGTGANLHNDDMFGGSGSFDYSVNSQPTTWTAFYKNTTMEMNMTNTGGVTNCIPDGEGCDNNNVLFVVGDLNLNASDASVRNRLESTGYSVTLADDHELQPWDAMGYGLVIVSSTVNSEHVDGTFSEVPVPVLTWESWIYDDMWMTEPGIEVNYGAVSSKYLNITNPDHAISAGKSGEFKIYHLSRQTAWGIPVAGGSAVASPMNAPGKYGLFAYDTGHEMAGGAYAPARRVGFFLGNQSGNWMTNTARDLFDASVAWAIDCQLTDQTFPMIIVENEDENIIAEDFEEEVALDFDLFPNPANDDLYIELNQETESAIQISIFNHVGALVQQISVDAGYGSFFHLNLNNLSAGYHFVKVESGNEVVVKRLVIVK